MTGWLTRTYFRRILLTAFLLVLASSAVLGWISSGLARTYLSEQLQGSLAAMARLMAERGPGAEQPGAWAARQGKAAGVRVDWLAPDGRVLGDSEAAGPGAAAPSASDGRLLYAEAKRPDGSTVRLSVPLAELESQLGRLRRAILLATLVCLLGALAASALAARSVSAPVEALRDTAQRISEGEFGAQAERPETDELGTLGDVLNELSSRVASLVGELSAEKAQLEATLRHMTEAVAVVDAEGRILEANPAMERVFGVEAERVRGLRLLEGFRFGRLEDLTSAAVRERSHQSAEISLFTPEERIFEAHADPILDEGEPQGAVLVLHDITRLRRLEEVRKDFVANVSHELRTPLASIKGFSETLRRGGLEDEANRLEFVETIERHADHLTRLVEDLLELAAIESDKRPPKPEPVELGAAVREALSGLAPAAEGKGVRLEAAGGALTALADRGQLRQILLNLVDNAVKYNRRGGAVRVAWERAGDRVRVTVSDDGPGIPAADLPRVFERFYRVDKARSREQGGTGLGLSIVKHLVEANGGVVRVESREGKGSAFHVDLPAA